MSSSVSNKNSSNKVPVVPSLNNMNNMNGMNPLNSMNQMTSIQSIELNANDTNNALQNELSQIEELLKKLSDEKNEVDLFTSLFNFVFQGKKHEDKINAFIQYVSTHFFPHWIEIMLSFLSQFIERYHYLPQFRKVCHQIH